MSDWKGIVALNYMRPKNDSIIVQASVDICEKEIVEGKLLGECWRQIISQSHPEYGDPHKQFDPSIFMPLDLDRFLAVRCRAVSGMEKWGANCVPAGTMIRMADGTEKSVEKIIVGDEVISHTGQARKVTKLFNYDNYRELLGIRSYGWCEPLWLTQDQKVWALKEDEFAVLKREAVYYQTCPTNARKRDYQPAISMSEAKEELAKRIELRWIPANELHRNDVVAMSFDNKIEIVDELNRPEIARLFGYYLSEGCRHRNGLVFVTHIDEIELRADLDHIAMILDKPISHHQGKDIGINIVRTHIGSGMSTGIHFSRSKQPKNCLIDLCERHCGKYSNQKLLSQSIMRMPHEWQREFLLAYLAGDGSQHKEDRGRYAGTVRGVTSSMQLAQQLQEMMWRMKVHSSISGRMNPGRFTKGFENSGMIYEIAIGAVQFSKLMNGHEHFKFSDLGEGREEHSIALIGDGMVYLPISKTFKKAHEGRVYDFEVEKDLSYVANRVNIYDSNGDAFPAVELAKSYLTLIAKGFYKEHNSFDPANAIGIIAHAQWFPEEEFVEIVALVDKILFPQEANEIRDAFGSNKRAGVSIGCIAGSAECSICGSIAHNLHEVCAHMDRSNPSCIKGKSLPNGRLAYDICRDLLFYETSKVNYPADYKALPRYVRGAEIRPKEEPEVETKDVGIISTPDEAMQQKLVNRAINQAIKSRVNKMVKAEVDRVLGPYLKDLQIQVKPEIKEKVEEKREEVVQTEL